MSTPTPDTQGRITLPCADCGTPLLLLDTASLHKADGTIWNVRCYACQHDHEADSD